MAVTIENSTEYANAVAKPARNNPTYSAHGRLRVAYFKHTQAVAGDIGSSVNLVKLPAGKIRVLRDLSVIKVTDLAASTTIDVGYRAHVKDDGLQTAVPLSVDHFIDGLDTASAATSTLFNQDNTALPTTLFESQDGVVIYATVGGGALAPADVIEGYITYIQD